MSVSTSQLTLLDRLHMRHAQACDLGDEKSAAIYANRILRFTADQTTAALPLGGLTYGEGERKAVKEYLEEDS